MQRLQKILKSEQGSAMLLALMVFLVLTVIGTSIMTVAAMEHRIACFDTSMQLAQQAADSGIELARDTILQGFIDNKSLAEIETEVKGLSSTLPNGANVYIIDPDNPVDGVDFTNFNTEGEIKLSATGKYGKSKRTVSVILSFTTMPNKAIHTDQLKVLGKYYLESDKVPVEWAYLGYEEGYYPNADGYAAPDPDSGPSTEPKGRSIIKSKTDPATGLPAFWWAEDSETKQVYFGTTGWPHYTPIYKTWYHIHYAPYYLAQGKLDVVQSDAWFNHWDDTASFNDVFNKDAAGNNKIWTKNDMFYDTCSSEMEDSLKFFSMGNCTAEPVQPGDVTFQSSHFTNNLQSLGQLGTLQAPPKVSKSDIDRFRKLSQNESDWQYINGGSSNYTLYGLDVEEPYVFVDLPEGSMLTISYGAPPGKTLFEAFFNFFIKIIKYGFTGTPSIMVATPADINITFDSSFDQTSNKNSNLFLISPGDINIRFNQINTVKWNIYALAGNDINILGRQKSIVNTGNLCVIKGSLNASNNVNVALDYFTFDAGILENKQLVRNDVVIKVERKSDIIDSFPYRWNLLGAGRITQYESK